MAGGAAGETTNSHTVNMDGLSAAVNGYTVKNDDDLEDTIIQRFNDILNGEGSVRCK